jgi:2-keto-4-pentenoate hydratase/2-oxohepta-3-ene-1,7-dioic acid hydratase in catechol pathway
VKLLAYTRDGAENTDTRLGISTDTGIRDLTDRLGIADVGELLSRGLSIDELPTSEGQPIDPASVQLRAPIARPGKIICVGLNYHDHCREQNVQPPTYPMLFSKFEARSRVRARGGDREACVAHRSP